MNEIRGGLFLIAALFALSAWTQEGEEAGQAEEAPDIDRSEVEEIAIDPDSLPPSEPGCFNVRSVRSFSPLHDEYILVEERRNQHFLITMDRGCFGLRNANGIAIDNVISRVCSNSQARITYRGIGGRLETCRARQIESVEDIEAARRIVEIRTR